MTTGTAVAPRNLGGRPPKYDWDAWFARGRVTLRKGRDYHCTTVSLWQQVRNAASKRGIGLTIEELDGGLCVRVVSSEVG